MDISPKTTVEDVNIQMGIYIVRKYFWGEVNDCYSTTVTAMGNYGYEKPDRRFTINTDIASLLINNVPAAKNLPPNDNIYGIFLIEDTKNEIMVLLEHHTGQDYAMGYVQYIPGHFFRGTCSLKEKK